MNIRPQRSAASTLTAGPAASPPASRGTGETCMRPCTRSCGSQAWPHRPLHHAPLPPPPTPPPQPLTLAPTTPVRADGSTCMPNTAAAPSSAPSATITEAPPCPSSCTGEPSGRSDARRAGHGWQQCCCSRREGNRMPKPSPPGRQALGQQPPANAIAGSAAHRRLEEEAHGALQPRLHALERFCGCADTHVRAWADRKARAETGWHHKQNSWDQRQQKRQAACPLQGNAAAHSALPGEPAQGGDARQGGRAAPRLSRTR